VSAEAAAELYDPLLHNVREDLYEIYERMREDHPVYHCERRDVWCLTRFDDTQSAARDWESFSNANGVDLDIPPRFLGVGNFLEEDPPRHDVLRKVVRPFFLPKEIAKLQWQITRRVEHVGEGLSGADRIDAAQDLAWALPVWVICRMLGAPEADDHLVQQLVTELETRRPDTQRHADRVRPILNRLHDYIDDLAEHKRRSPGEDVMSRLVAGEHRQAPRREEIRGITGLLLTAGSMTAAALIGNTLRVLAEHPDAQRALRAAPQMLIEATVEEVLRFDSPVQYLARRTSRPVRLHDREIPAQADVVLIYGAANRDQRHFAHAETFDIHRPAQRNLGFGEGIHFCLGAALARLQARAVVLEFLRIAPEYEVDEGGVKRFVMPNMRGYLHLPVVVGQGRRADG
jgi:cytochrome P450